MYKPIKIIIIGIIVTIIIGQLKIGAIPTLIISIVCSWFVGDCVYSKKNKG
jgi:hypothetical protein